MKRLPTLGKEDVIRAVESILFVADEPVDAAEQAHAGGTLMTVSGCHGFCELGPLVHILPDDVLEDLGSPFSG